ncbi:ABC transporter ATP-binding protein [Pinisolibacter sp.]|uniref:ABC transporter ATP-binding protein n=1 Tax=Pinisolibacter sp. TaxID=2172024 RepID=UPI002FDE958F
MIELTGVTKVYDQDKPTRVDAVRGVDLTIDDGRVTVLAGPSGSGKTTLLTVIGCLARPTTGRVTIDGDLVSGLPERFLTEVRRKTFGFVFQRFNLIRGMSALDNVMLPAYPTGIAHAALRDRALALLDHFGLADRSRAVVETLSGGESQRVAIARALINDPAVVIADEPTASLDGARVEQFLTIAADLKAQGKTVLITSHDPRITRAALVDRLVAMADGRIVEATP